MGSWCGLTALVVACAVTAASHGHAADPPSGDWPVYGHDPGSARFSPLTQINRDNVSKLTVAWTFHTGDISDGSGDRRRSGFEATPIVVDGTLYPDDGVQSDHRARSGTGTQRWAFDPQTELTLGYGDGLINRGVATWLDLQRPAEPALPAAHLRGNARRAAGLDSTRRRDSRAPTSAPAEWSA